MLRSQSCGTKYCYNMEPTLLVSAQNQRGILTNPIIHWESSNFLIMELNNSVLKRGKKFMALTFNLNIQKLGHFQILVTLVDPQWEVQPWFQILLKICSQPIHISLSLLSLLLPMIELKAVLDITHLALLYEIHRSNSGEHIAYILLSVQYQNLCS